MADYNYDFVARYADFTWGYPSAAARSAVVTPLAAAMGLATTEITEQCEQILRLWRRRLVWMADCGWSAFAGLPKAVEPDEPDQRSRRIQYYRNCPPFGVRWSRRANPCNRVRVCPWCYGRMVMDVYNHLTWAFYLNQRTLQLQGHKLVVFRRVMQTSLAGKTLAEVLDSYADTLKFDLTRFDKSLRGYVVVTSVEPNPEVAQSVRAVRSTLAIVPEDLKYKQPERLPPRGLTDPSRADIVNQIGYALSYPTRMMLGDCNQAVAIANALSATRTKLVAMGSVDPKFYRKETDHGERADEGND